MFLVAAGHVSVSAVCARAPGLLPTRVGMGICKYAWWNELYCVIACWLQFTCKHVLHPVPRLPPYPLAGGRKSYVAACGPAPLKVAHGQTRP